LETEDNRVQALMSYAILDTEREVDFDEISELAAEITSSPIAMISFIDHERQWIKSSFGADINEIPKDTSYCSDVIRSPDKALVINDAVNDEIYSNKPFILNGKLVVFYVGIPLVDNNNFVIGTLSIVDYVSKQVSQKEMKILQSLAKGILRLVELKEANEIIHNESTYNKKYLELNNPFFLIINSTNEIVDFGKSFKKAIPELTINTKFSDYFDTQIDFSSFKESDESTKKRITFISRQNKQLFKCSIVRINSKIIISAQPIINENYPIKVYNITINDFSQHDYIIEYLFLQQSSQKSLFESRRLMDSMTEKNLQLEEQKSEIEKKQNAIKSSLLQLQNKEQEIKEQKLFYEFILNNLPADLAVFSPDHKYLFINPAGIKNTEMRNFMIGKDDFDYCQLKGIDNKLAVERRAKFNELVRTKKFIEWEDVNVLENGVKQITLRKIGPIYDEHNALKMVIGYGIDITERKIAEEITIKAKKEVENINLNLKKLVSEETQKNLTLSKSLTDYEKMATIGELASGIAHDLNTPLSSIRNGSEAANFTINSILQELIWKCTREQLNFAIQRASSNNESSIFTSGLELMRLSKNFSVYLSGKFTNYPEIEIKEISSAFVRARIDINEEELIDQIMNSSNSLSFLKLIENLQTYISFVNSIEISSNRALNVVNDLRLNIKNQNSTKSHVNLKENLSSVLNIFNFELEQKVKVDLKIADSIVIYGYDIKLFQLWSNIIKNALEAMESNKGDKLLKISASETKDTISVSIKNNGPAIPIENQHKIFEKFYSTKVGLSSSGLGMSIVKNIITDHGAKILLESTDLFTTFTINFKKV
jgi:signal transduction histidine kinase